MIIYWHKEIMDSSLKIFVRFENQWLYNYKEDKVQYVL